MKDVPSGTDIQEIAQAASRAYEDPRFAQEVLEGKHDYPQVRDAILLDLGSDEPDGPDGLQGAMRTGDMHVARLAERARPW